jgi:hypothetical protein
MTYKINSVEIACPTTMKWEDKREHGTNGNGNPVYGRYRSAQLTWNVMYPEDFELVQRSYLHSQTSGSVVVELPRYGASTYGFNEYSGCYLEDLQMGEFFDGHYMSVTLIVTKVSA